jgi:hypothetical protein
MESKIIEMDKCIRCLALELPGPVWDDVNRIWQDLKTEISKPILIIDPTNLIHPR